MDRKEWKKRIEQATKDAGTYKAFFDDTIDTLADILEKRDAANDGYIETGSQPVITYTNTAGKENGQKNPYLILIDEYNKTALAYWRDLGLTPKGLKAINDQAMKGKQKAGLSELLEDLGG